MSTNQAETAGCNCTAFGKCPFHSSKWLLHNGKTCGGLIKELEDTRELNAKSYGIIAKLEAENKLLREEWEMMREELRFYLTVFTMYAENKVLLGKINDAFKMSMNRVLQTIDSLKFSPSQK